MTGGHNRYHNRTQGEQSDCMVSDYDSMRLVHRRNNPNKETLIYIPLSHVTEIQAYRIRVANHITVKREYISEIITGIMTGITGGHNRYHITTGIYYYYYSSDPYI